MGVGPGESLIWLSGKAPRRCASRTPGRVSSLFHAPNFLWLMLVFAEPPCLSRNCSILLKLSAGIHSASRSSSCARWFQSIARGHVRLNSYTLTITSCSCELKFNMTHCALPGYRSPWCVIKVAILSVSTIHVPPLNRHVCAEKEPSFHKLVPPSNSKKWACLRHVVSGILVFCNSRISIGGVVYQEGP